MDQKKNPTACRASFELKAQNQIMSSSIRPAAGLNLESIRFSCFHGEKWKRPPVDEATLRGATEITKKFIDRFYKEAARRLPLNEMPDLDGCICAGGLCLGLADPVSNIILNAVGLLLHDQQEQEDLPPPQREFRVRKEGTQGWGCIAFRSLDGLRGFMTAYFRYLGYTGASRYLYLASHHLPLAIALVHHDRGRRLLPVPDAGNLRDALRVAAVNAKHPAPAVLARLMTAQYPSGLLATVLAKLQGTEPLTAGDVSEIKDLLARQWPPAVPPVNMEFWCRPNGGGTCTRGDDGTLLISTCIGDDGRAATLMIPPPAQDRDQQQLRYISDLTFHGADMEDKLSSCLRAAAVTAPAPSAQPPVDYDASPCTHILCLGPCLLDAIHAMYIRALAMLPSYSPRVLRALMVAGHCYGPMDPVSNIIVNTVWYDKAFPLLAEEANKLPQGGILDTRAMLRLAKRSLKGLMEMASATCRSQHEALEHLSSLDCDLSRSQGRSKKETYAAAAMAAKHPQHAAFGSFVASLTTDDKLSRLRCLLAAGDGRIISDANWEELTSMIHGEQVCPSSEARPCLSISGSMQVSTKTSDYQDKLDFVKSHLKKLLRRYCYQHPWEPSYQVDVVCGVWQSISTLYRPTVYHANFLATIVDHAINSPRERTLFFAEFWEVPYREDIQQPKPSICCPISDYSVSVGRCSHCETEAHKIMHPPSGGHSGIIDGLNGPYPGGVRGVGLEDLVDSDFVYFDPNRDVELAEAINDSSAYLRNDMPVTPWTQKPKPSSSSSMWGWSGDNLFRPLPKNPAGPRD